MLDSISPQKKYLFAQFAYIFIAQSIFTSLTSYLIENNFSTNEAILLAGRLGSALYLSVAFFGLMNNKTIDGQKISVLMGFFLSGISVILLCFVQQKYIFIAAGILALSTGFVKSSLSVVYGHYIEKKEVLQDKAYRLLYASANIGAILGPAAFGFLPVAQYQYIYISCCILSFLTCGALIVGPISTIYLRKNYLLFIAIFFVMTTFIYGHDLMSLASGLLLFVYLLNKKKTLKNIKKINFVVIGHVFFISLFIDQKYFLLQKLFISESNTPFKAPFLYTLSSLVVVIGIFLQVRSQKKNPVLKFSNPIISYGAVLLGYAFLCFGYYASQPLWMWIIIAISFFSIAEIKYLPYALSALSNHDSEKILGVSLFFLAMGGARYIAVKFNNIIETEGMLITTLLCNFIIIVCLSFFKKHRK